MLISDFRSSETTKIKTINKFLSENFGIIVSSDDIENTKNVRDKLSESIVNMKRDSLGMKDDIYVKTALTLMAVDSLLESQLASRPHKVYRQVLANLYNTAVNLVNIGDDIDEAVSAVMREYRSSQYRFPDKEIEYDLRAKLVEYVNLMELEVNEGCISEDGTQEDEIPLWFCDDCTIGRVNDDFSAIDDEDRYEEVTNAVYSLPPNISFAGEQDEHSIDPCDCCGTNLHGARHKFIQLP